MAGRGSKRLLEPGRCKGGLGTIRATGCAAAATLSTGRSEMSLDAPQPNEPPTLGATLRMARIAAGYSIAEVTRQLKLEARLVEAIEADERRGLPAEVYLRGYVRKYAKLVGVDAEPLLKSLQVEAPQDLVQNVPIFRLSGSRLQPLVIALAAIGSLALVVGAVFAAWYWSQESGAPAETVLEPGPAGEPVFVVAQPSTAPEQTTTNPASELPQVDSAPAIESARMATPQASGPATAGTGSASGSTQLDSGAPAVDQPGLPGPASTDERAEASGDGQQSNFGTGPAAAASQELQPAVVTADQEEVEADLDSEPDLVASPREAAVGDLLLVRRITPVGEDELWLEFTEDCWVEVLTTDDVGLYGRLLRRGQSLRLVGSGPFKIRLGYALGVTLEYNGEPIPLAPHTRNTIASLVVGQ